MKISIIIPAHNEAAHISSVLDQIKTLGLEIIVVDDGSSDKSFELAKASGALVLRHIINRGQGAALRTGTNYALKNGADIIVHFDGDGQFRVQDIPIVIQPLIDNQADAVFGSRFLGASNMPGFKKNIIMPLARLTNRLFFGIKMTDPQSGFRALNRKSAELIKIDNDGMAHCSEILIKAHKNKLRIIEVPIVVTYHEFGQKFSGAFKILIDLFYKNIIN